MHAQAEEAAEFDDDDIEGASEGGSPDEEDDEEYIDVDPAEVFDEIKSEGKDFVTFAQIKNWEVVASLQEDGLLSDSDLKAICQEAGVKDTKKIGFEGFEAILDLLGDRFGDDDEDGEEE